MGVDGYDLVTTGLELVSSGFNCAMIYIVHAYTGRRLGNDEAGVAHSRINSRVYKGGKVSS